jgi:hypothetical protein
VHIHETGQERDVAEVITLASEDAWDWADLRDATAIDDYRGVWPQQTPTVEKPIGCDQNLRIYREWKQSA